MTVTIAYLRPRLLAVAAAMLAAAPCGAGTQVVPGIDVRQRYTDNVALAREGHERGMFLTEVAPNISITRSTPGLELSARYQFHYFIYQNAGGPDTARRANRLSADARARLVRDLLYLDASATIQDQAVSAFGPFTDDTYYARGNRTEVRTARISPYLSHRFGSGASVFLRATHDWSDTNHLAFGKSETDTAQFSASTGTMFRRVALGVDASHQVVQESVAEDSSSQSASATVRLLVTPELSLSATGGYDEYDFTSFGGPTRGDFWMAGFAWQPSSRSSLQARVGNRFFGRTYFLLANHRSRRTAWNISYDEQVTTSRAQFFLPQTVDTAALLDRILSPVYPDPVQRRLAVLAYMQATGLPPTLTDSVNYLSNRYMLLKQFNASGAVRTGRSSIVLSVFHSNRRALSILEADSRLLGTVDAMLNDHTRQRGASLAWNWRILPRTSANVGLVRTRSDSLTTGRRHDTSTLGLALTTQFTPRTRGILEYRHVRGTLHSGAGDYRENSVAAALSMKF